MRYVEIDGEKYMIDACVNCMFMDKGDSGYGAHCNYPVKKGYIDLEHVYYTAYDKEGVRVSERCGLREVGEEGEKRYRELLKEMEMRVEELSDMLEECEERMREGEKVE